MDLHRKRHYHDHSPPSTSDSRKKCLAFSHRSPYQYHDGQHQLPQQKCPTFVSYLEVPTLSPKIKTLCEIVSSTPSLDVEKVLDEAGIPITQEDVEEVLKLSYGFPGSAVKFFRWSGYQLKDNHSPYSWNLVVDLLGKNLFFDAMWDAIKSMKKEGLLSLATFASVFSSYVAVGRVQEAIMTFDVMEKYGCPRDIIALNSLLSAICREGRTVDAYEYLRIAKGIIRPDPDTYAILLEGWESERNGTSARHTFAEMVIEIGWDPSNAPAYDSFLCTLIREPNGIHESLKFFDSMRENKCYPGMKFFKVALDECVKCHDTRVAEMLWEIVVERLGLKPDPRMCNAMIALYCYRNDIDTAKRMLDDMVYRGAFPDSLTYNLLFRFLIKGRKLQEASLLFTEMIKNECVPDQPNCETAVRIYIDSRDPNMAIRIWKCLVDNFKKDLEETANLLVVGLCDLKRVPEAVKYAEDIIDRGIKLTSSTLAKLKQSLVKARKEFVYEGLVRKWKTHEVVRLY
ncbi:pentatricopeptide repeat-containing protein At1g77360, mitochondrial-like [Neltuma alba]|uniref:pentatricopeptide repeat-containing protein At1g77360, mitochondrial-like n=1 Tax=Neltuma alba TaxID=207710 RepID=UPI0010A53DEA|nr:pentatricopeptide repeat-containing protein At1g77360, mitochondrial-like [Prosopis alba]